MTVTPDGVMARIGSAIELGHTRSREEGRSALSSLWEEFGPTANPLHQCVVAHHLADLQDNPREEYRWDERALDAANELLSRHDPAPMPPGGVTVEQLYPSLHLNLADVSHRLGDHDRARDHLARARSSVAALDDDGYGQMLRRGIAGLADRMSS